MDVFSPKTRSRVMSRIRGKNTKPEIAVRSLLHKLGFRFRLHRKDLPGTPDIVLPKYNTVIFIHGCFWHGHKGCPKAKRPTSNEQFWNKKLDKTIERDRKNQTELKKLEWRVLVIWSCEVRNPDTLKHKLITFLTDNN